MFCPKCGEKNKEGARFCTKCGEKLQNKKTKILKNIDTEKIEKEVKVKTDEVKEVTKEMTDKTTDIIKDMVSKPVDALKKHGTEKNYNLAFALIVVLSLLTGLFTVIMIKQMQTPGINSLRCLTEDGCYGSTYIPYFKIFFITFITTIIASFAFPGILYFVCNVIFKGKESYKKMLVIYGIISIYVSTSLMGAIIISFISIKLASLLLLLGLALSGFYIFHMIRLVGPKDENKHGYIFIITETLFCTLIFIVIQLLI